MYHVTIKHIMKIFIKVLIALIFVSICSWLYIHFIGIGTKIDFSKTDDSAHIVNNMNSGDLDGAISDADKSVAKYKNNEQALVLLALAYQQKGSLTFQEVSYSAKSLEVADEILKINPNSGDAYRIKGYAYEMVQNYTESETNYKKALELAPSDAMAHANLGHAYELQSKDELAINGYKDALAINPDFVPALLGMMRYSYNNNNKTELKTYAEKVLSLAPDVTSKSDAEQMLGFVYQSEKNLSEASKHFDNAISFEPKSAAVYVSRANNNLLIMSGEKDNGKRSVSVKEIFDDADNAIKLDPNLSEAYLLWARLAPSLQNPKEAATHFYNEALKKVDVDITLSKAEKESMKNLILSEMKSESIKITQS